MLLFLFGVIKLMHSYFKSPNTVQIFAIICPLESSFMSFAILPFSEACAILSYHPYLDLLVWNREETKASERELQQGRGFGSLFCMLLTLLAKGTHTYILDISLLLVTWLGTGLEVTLRIPSRGLGIQLSW